MFTKCKNCADMKVTATAAMEATKLAYQSLRAENEYLKRIIDRLLGKCGLLPANEEQVRTEVQIDPELRDLRDRGAKMFGIEV